MKKVVTCIKSLGVIVIALGLLDVFGLNEITNFVLKQIFTPFTVVGILMTVATIFGVSITKKQGHWLFIILTLLTGLGSVFVYVSTILSWFGIQLLPWIIEALLKPAVVSIGTILLWICIGIIAIAVLGFIVYTIIKTINHTTKERAWKTNKIVYESQRKLLEKIAIENDKNIIKPIAKIVKNNLRNNLKQAQTHQTFQTKKSQDDNAIKSQLESKLIILPADYELKISNNICPKCGWFLTKRINKKTREQFRGCSNYGYNNCTFTISDKEYLRIYKKYH